MPAETATQLLHRLTSYEPGREWTEPVADERIVQTLPVVNDLSRLPLSYKHYDGPRRPLPRDLPGSSLPATDVLAGIRPAQPAALNLSELARLLYLSAGVTRSAERNGRRILFRAAGSAGARFPLEVYLAVPRGSELPAGVHWYDPVEHALVEIGPPPSGETPTLVLTGVPWRTGWRYRERGYRHIFWDAGTMLAQLLALADSAGVTARLFSQFPDGTVSELIGADGHQEFPVAVVALGPGAPVLVGAEPARPGQFEPDAIEFPLVTRAHHAGDRTELGAELERGAPVTSAGSGDPLDQIVLRRGSTRRMDPTATLPRPLLLASMTAALRGIDVPHWIAVHAVEDVEPGLYHWPELLRPIRAGNLRDDLHRVSLEQGLARDAAFVVIAAADLGRLDDSGYRRAQLQAGLVEGRLHLVAYALGAGASGMTFQDSDIPALLRPDGAGSADRASGTELSGLLWTCVGQPEYRSRPGGAPGQPTEVRMVAPR